MSIAWDSKLFVILQAQIPTDQGPVILRHQGLRRRVARLALGAAALYALFITVGCIAPSGATFQITPGDADGPGAGTISSRNAGAAGDGKALDWVAAGGEWLGIPLTLQGSSGGAGGGLFSAARWQGVSIHLAPFTGDNGNMLAPPTSVYRIVATPITDRPGWQIRYVSPLEWPAETHDVLIPAEAPTGGAPWPLTGDQPLSVWVDIFVPPGSPSGLYQSSIQIVAADKVVHQLPVTLTVLPFDLPRETGVSLISPVDHESLFHHHINYQGEPLAPRQVWSDSPMASQLDGLLYSTCAMLMAHGVQPLIPRFAPIVKVSAQGELTVNWDEYDRVMAPLMAGQDRESGALAGAQFLQLPFDRSWPVDVTKTPLSESPTAAKALQAYFRNAAVHLGEKGWLARSFVNLPVDCGDGAEAFKLAAMLGQMVHEAHPGLRTLVQLFPQDMAQYGWWHFQNRVIENEVDIWCPPATFCEPSAMEFQRQVGKLPFFSPTHPPYSPSLTSQSAPVHARALAWLAYRYHQAGVLLEGATSWPTNTRFADAIQIQALAPQSLLYPGSIAGMDQPLPSMRLKQLRQGLQDLAWLRLAEQHGLNFMAASLAESLVPLGFSDAYGAHFANGRWPSLVEDERWWNSARLLLADGVTRKVGSPIGSLANFDSGLEWQRVMNETRSWQVQVDGVRIRPAPSTPVSATRVNVTLNINNATRLPITGRFSWTDLPPGWKEVGEPQQITAAPGARQPVLLSLDSSSLSWDANGVRSLFCVFETDDGRRQDIEVRLAYTVAQRVARPPVIDGDLSDWSPLATHHAGDFRWISDPTVSAHEDASRGPQTTDVFVSRDEDFLYFGIQCWGRGHDSGLSEPGNRVHYDHLIPVGDDLVEILIDPFNTGTYSTQDLYHVAIKPTGAVAERGIATEPPIGLREPWPIDLQYSVRKKSDRWVAEVRLPLDAFPENAETSEVWGMNFTRFDHESRQFTTWSGARYHAYQPLTLGNVAISQPELPLPARSR